MTNVSSSTTLTLLGTGYATATRCYNTCFTLQSGDDVLLVDAGGGNQILNQLEKAQIRIENIHNLFLTHAHTDHILGAIWIVRIIAQKMIKRQYEGTLHIFSHDKALHVLEWICRQTLPGKTAARLGNGIELIEVKDGECVQAGTFGLQCFDIHSTKEKQFGFCTQLPDGQKLTCLGDEPYNEANRAYAENADWLLCEAFCLYEDRERFKPYEKHHSTALDAGRLAQTLHVKNLLLYHTEDTALDRRKALYTAEAQTEFDGKVYVPDDLEQISLNS